MYQLLRKKIEDLIIQKQKAKPYDLVILQSVGVRIQEFEHYNVLNK